MTLYTRTGDQGETALFDGSRVSKADPRIDACGHVDELNTVIGMTLATGVDADVSEQLVQLQRDLFAVGALIADPRARIAPRVTKASLGTADVARLEGWIDAADAQVPPLRHFLLPGGSPAGAMLHQARTICRRAERHVVGLGPRPGGDVVLVYLNRLSDLLFVLARVVNARAGVPEREW